MYSPTEQPIISWKLLANSHFRKLNYKEKSIIWSISMIYHKKKLMLTDSNQDKIAFLSGCSLKLVRITTAKMINYGFLIDDNSGGFNLTTEFFNPIDDVSSGALPITLGLSHFWKVASLPQRHFLAVVSLLRGCNSPSKNELIMHLDDLTKLVGPPLRREHIYGMISIFMGRGFLHKMADTGSNNIHITVTTSINYSSI